LSPALLRWTALILALAAAGTIADDGRSLDSVAISLANAENPFFIQLGRGAEQAVKRANPAATVTTLGAGYDLHKQSSQIDTFIARKVDLIVLTAVDSEAIGPAVQRARAAGIVVVAADVVARHADLAVTTDNVKAGEIACEFMANRLGGHGDVAILNGPPVSSVRDRVRGCRQALARSPGLTLVSDAQDAKGSIEGGQHVMSALLTAHPELDAAFAINDPTAIGAELAARQARRSDLFLTAVDGAPMAERALKAPNGLFAATASQDPWLLGERAIELGLKVLRGEPVEALNLIEPKLVTRDNVADYVGWTGR
jgi:ribose transport system substrate-binding protein